LYVAVGCPIRWRRHPDPTILADLVIIWSKAPAHSIAPWARPLPCRSLRSGVVARRSAHQNPRAPHLAPTGCL